MKKRSLIHLLGEVIKDTQICTSFGDPLRVRWQSAETTVFGEASRRTGRRLLDAASARGALPRKSTGTSPAGYWGDTPANMGIAEEQPGKEVGLEFVLAGLEGKDDDKGETQAVNNGFFNGKGNTALVGTEVDTAGGSPSDWVTADSPADTEGNGRLRVSIKHEGHRGHNVIDVEETATCHPRWCFAKAAVRTGKGWQARALNAKRDGTCGHPLPDSILEHLCC